MAWCSSFFLSQLKFIVLVVEQLFENSYLSQLLQETEFREGLTKEMKTATYKFSYLIK